MKENDREWEVLVKCTTKKETEKYLKEDGEDPESFDINEVQDIEVSIIRKDNDHGHISYGWDDEDKIILTGAGDCDTKKELKWWKKVAQIMCDALNKAGV